MPMTILTGDGKTPSLPTFAELIATYTEDKDDVPFPDSVSLAAVLAGGDDPLKLIGYLTGLGLEIRQLDDLLTINGDDTEEELHAFQCIEGIALLIASDGLFVLFTS